MINVAIMAFCCGFNVWTWLEYDNNLCAGAAAMSALVALGWAAVAGGEANPR